MPPKKKVCFSSPKDKKRNQRKNSSAVILDQPIDSPTPDGFVDVEVEVF